MKYIVEKEYEEMWGDESPIIVDEDEIARLAAAWETPVEELMEQVEYAVWYSVRKNENDVFSAMGSYDRYEAEKMLDSDEFDLDAYIAEVDPDDGDVSREYRPSWLPQRKAVMVEAYLGKNHPAWRENDLFVYENCSDVEWAARDAAESTRYQGEDDDEFKQSYEYALKNAHKVCGGIIIDMA